MPDPIVLRDADPAGLLVAVRLGSGTLADGHLSRSCAQAHGRRGVWGFSVLEVPDRDYRLLARLRPIVAERRQLFEADGSDLIAAGFPLLPTLDHPHWTVVLPEVTPQKFELVRSVFRGPKANPAWIGRDRPVR